MRFTSVTTGVLPALFLLAPTAAAQQVTLEAPEVFLRNVPMNVTVAAPESLVPVDVAVRLGDGTLLEETTIEPLGAVTIDGVRIGSRDQARIEVEVDGEVVAAAERRLYPGFVAILPPLAAIVLALVFREVVTSLFAGIWIGCLLLNGFHPMAAVFETANRFVRDTMTDSDHVAIVLFTLMLGGMVGIAARMGGMRAVVETVTPLATTRRRGQLATWLAGVVVFFDDYSNSLIVGNTLRPLTDRLRISREKLAFIVDATAAPVAALFLISTWIGYELGLIGDGLEVAAAQSSDPAMAAELLATTPFRVFLSTIPFLFYPIFTIVLVGTVAATGRDFGPMLEAERRAAAGRGLYREGAQLATDIGSELQEVESVPPGRWWNGVIPVAVLVGTVLWGLAVTGLEATPEGERTLFAVLANVDPYSPLLWGTTAACIAGLILAAGQRILPLGRGLAAWTGGVRAMTMAIVILALAWSLGDVTEALGTAAFLVDLLSETLAPALLPAAVFITSSLIAFATGTSWTTMAILFPIVIPLAVALGGGGITPETESAKAVIFGAIGSVLAGSIMGDHCSPISDTTVLSSTASSCDHVDHVRTQLPYAVSVGLVALVVGNLLSSLGVPAWICLILGSAVIVGAVRVFGKRLEVPS